MNASTPPLLAICEGTKARPRKAPVMRPREIKLHMDVAKVLREHALPEWQWCHIPNGELRDKHTAGKLKQMGVKPGWPDFILAPPSGQLHCLELKRYGETLSEVQETFQLWCIRHNVPHSVADSLDQALAVFDHWGCLRLKIGGAR
jgi:hypothetical protein